MRHLLLNYLHDYRTRVSIFLKKGLQSEAGFFYLDLEQPLPAGVQVNLLRFYLNFVSSLLVIHF